MVIARASNNSSLLMLAACRLSSDAASCPCMFLGENMIIISKKICGVIFGLCSLLVEVLYTHDETFEGFRLAFT